jgi:hypothetical protein
VVSIAVPSGVNSIRCTRKVAPSETVTIRATTLWRVFGEPRALKVTAFSVMVTAYGKTRRSSLQVLRFCGWLASISYDFVRKRWVPSFRFPMNGNLSSRDPPKLSRAACPGALAASPGRCAEPGPTPNKLCQA